MILFRFEEYGGFGKMEIVFDYKNSFIMLNVYDGVLLLFIMIFVMFFLYIYCFFIFCKMFNNRKYVYNIFCRV